MHSFENDRILPLTKLSSSVALIGPWTKATTQMQGNYYGTAPYLVSPLSAFQSHVPDVTYAQDCNQQLDQRCRLR
jgi:beta-D-xylosidase 4